MNILGIFGKKKNNQTEKPAACSCSGSCCTSGDDSGKPGKEAETVGQSKGAGLAIKVLGYGCKSCEALLQNTKEAVQAMELPAHVVYITDLREIAKYGVMSTPALVVNEQVVSMGKVLKPAEVKDLLRKVQTSRSGKE